MYPFDFTRPIIGKANVQIHKPVADVFDFVGQHFFDNYTKWAPEISELRPLAGNVVFIGAKAQQIRLEQGQKVESTFEISEFEPPRKMTLVGIEPQFRNTYALACKGDNRITELEYSFELLELEFFMRPFEKLIRMAIEEGAENTVANIKNLMSEKRC